MIEPVYPALLSYWDCGSRIELHYPGSVLTYTDPEDLATLREWSRYAFSLYSRNIEEFKREHVSQEDVRLGYVEYMSRFGQYEVPR